MGAYKEEFTAERFHNLYLSSKKQPDNWPVDWSCMHKERFDKEPFLVLVHAMEISAINGDPVCYFNADTLTSHLKPDTYSIKRVRHIKKSGFLWWRKETEYFTEECDGKLAKICVRDAMDELSRCLHNKGFNYKEVWAKNTDVGNCITEFQITF